MVEQVPAKGAAFSAGALRAKGQEFHASGTARIIQVEENPIIIEEPSKTIEPAAARFTFKNAEDWKSLHSISERINLVKTCSLKKQAPFTPLEKISERNSRLFQFSPNKTEYRTREKLKELHKPMKFPAHVDRKEPTRKHRSLLVIK